MVLRSSDGSGPDQVLVEGQADSPASLKRVPSNPPPPREPLDGQSSARLEGEYDTLLTNRLILQWQAEAELYGKDDERRGIGSGLSTVEAGLRLRYEFTRKFAPYIGVAWERAYGRTADFRRDHGEDINDTRFVAGLRIWF